jgi:hypothetical protein
MMFVVYEELSLYSVYFAPFSNEKSQNSNVSKLFSLT